VSKRNGKGNGGNRSVSQLGRRKKKEEWLRGGRRGKGSGGRLFAARNLITIKYMIKEGREKTYGGSKEDKISRVCGTGVCNCLVNRGERRIPGVP